MGYIYLVYITVSYIGSRVSSESAVRNPRTRRSVILGLGAHTVLHDSVINYVITYLSHGQQYTKINLKISDVNGLCLRPRWVNERKLVLSCGKQWQLHMVSLIASYLHWQRLEESTWENRGMPMTTTTVCTRIKAYVPYQHQIMEIISHHVSILVRWLSSLQGEGKGCIFRFLQEHDILNRLSHG